MTRLKGEISAYKTLTFRGNCKDCKKEIIVKSHCSSLYSYFRHYYNVLKTCDMHLKKCNYSDYKREYYKKIKFIVMNAMDAWLY